MDKCHIYYHYLRRSWRTSYVSFGTFSHVYVWERQREHETDQWIIQSANNNLLRHYSNSDKRCYKAQAEYFYLGWLRPLPRTCGLSKRKYALILRSQRVQTFRLWTRCITIIVSVCIGRGGDKDVNVFCRGAGRK